MASPPPSPENVRVVKNPNHVSALLSGLRELKDTDCLSDVTVSVQGREFKSHRCVLAIFSDYWKTMFSSPMKERTQDTITLKDSDNITAEAFEKIISYIYTGELPLNTANVSDIFTASAVMCIAPLAKECVQFIADMFLIDQHKQSHEEREIELEDYMKYFAMIDTYSIPKLGDPVLKAIAQNFSVVCEREEFLRNISFEQLSAILDRSELASSSELQILQRVVSWVGADVTRRKHAPQLISKVRLGLIPISDIDRELKKSDLIQDPEVRIIYLDVLRSFSLDKETLSLTNTMMFTHRRFKSVLVSINTNKISKYLDTENWLWKKIEIPGTNNEIPVTHDDSDVDDDFEEAAPMPVSARIPNSSYAPPSWQSSNPIAVVTNNRIFVGKGQEFVCFDIGMKTWETLPNMLLTRYQFSMVYLNGYIYAIGGIMNNKALRSVERFDLGAGSWQSIASLNHPRYLACALIKEGLIYVIGGKNENSPITVIERFDPTLNQWQECGTSLVHLESTALVIDGQIWVGGGQAVGGRKHGPCEMLGIFSGDGQSRICGQDLIPKASLNARVFRIGKRVFFNLNGFCYEPGLVIGDDQVYTLNLGKWMQVFDYIAKNRSAIVSAVINTSNDSNN